MLNYLLEDLAFLEAGIAAPIAPKAHVLWHYLLYFNNRAAIFDPAGKAWWPVWFEVDMEVLKAAMAIRDAKQLYTYRQKLIKRGWIQFAPPGQTPEGCPDARAWGRGCGRGAQADGEVSHYALTPFAAGFEPILKTFDACPEGVLVWKGPPKPLANPVRKGSGFLPYNPLINNNKYNYSTSLYSKPEARASPELDDTEWERIKGLDGEARRLAMRAFCHADRWQGVPYDRTALLKAHDAYIAECFGIEL